MNLLVLYTGRGTGQWITVILSHTSAALSTSGRRQASKQHNRHHPAFAGALILTACLTVQQSFQAIFGHLGRTLTFSGFSGLEA
jgi:hypothetical protein